MATREVKIYCPKCAWAPVQSSRWQCACGCCWNTFDTAGVCPECAKVWTDTACLQCRQWSRHRAWYHDFFDGIESLEEFKVEPLQEPATAP